MTLNRKVIADKHAISFEGPAQDFFEGALLGNGGMGAVVTTRPDAIVIHFGHNNVWDIRIAEDHQDEIGRFEELFARIKEIPAHYASLTDDPWYREYVAMAGDNYDKPYPRPMPCGSLLLGFDRRTTEVLGHRLSLNTGLCEVELKVEEHVALLILFVDQEEDRLWVSLRSKDGGAPETLPNVFNRVKLIPDPYTPIELPLYEAMSDAELSGLTFRQKLPASLTESRENASKARAFRLSARLSSAVAVRESGNLLELAAGKGHSFTLCAVLEEGADEDVIRKPSQALAAIEDPDESAFDAAFARSKQVWERYWSRSGVELEDELLERVWYRNLYFFQCSVKPEAACPGLFANWSYGKIGAEWHGDYHMNYNTQQPFWVAFSSNHADKHLAYANMVDHVLPVSRKWAKDYYGLRGAYFPHSAYPVEMSMMPYPVPHWGWEVCETPWTVQSLWWHYLYTMDKAFLADRAFVPMKEAARFMADYMMRPGSSGEAWGDDRYHIFPTVVPELYELTPGFKRNRDCIVDLTLTKFLFRAFVEACSALDRTEAEKELLADISNLLGRFPEYPTAESQRGTVFVSVEGEDPEVVYNVPNGITTVFPGEEHGLHSPPDAFQTTVNSYRNHRNEGGNELVFLNLAGARLGQLDLERFKRQIVYCTLPNGTCTDKLLESGGRYSDTTPFDYMGRMGIWFENFALPAVINECLLQSYNGTLRLFPNWPDDKRAEFATLRAVGGFLVSAFKEAGKVAWIEVTSEAGSPLRMYNCWEGTVSCKRAHGELLLEGEILELDTVAGETLRFKYGESNRNR
ncbi:glycosyl hydrolase family 95 catalytic domain-containing protein [Paenibacillus sp. 2TAB19]|uniref:glycosyl hydrolase family 95 catalytic domain-containing protein n=1 Tax=Paenibacillus sp. 2TAB19 TaxID=3233003 RepID=UPI003F98CABD